MICFRGFLIHPTSGFKCVCWSKNWICQRKCFLIFFYFCSSSCFALSLGECRSSLSFVQEQGIKLSVSLSVSFVKKKGIILSYLFLYLYLLQRSRGAILSGGCKCFHRILNVGGAKWKININCILPGETAFFRVHTNTECWNHLGVESCSKALMVEKVRAYLAASLSYATVVCSNLWPQRISEGRYDVRTWRQLRSFSISSACRWFVADFCEQWF